MAGARERNHATYEGLWPLVRLQSHEIWAHAWAEIAPFARSARLLEIGPGKFPHLPARGTCFVDLSMAALRALAERGGACVRAASPLPFADAAFDVVCLFEVLEHVDEDDALLDEIARVLRPGGVLFLSCPMNPRYWTYYDGVVGHVRRYEAGALAAKLPAHGLAIEKVCARHDRMDRWFGALFGFALRYLTRITVKIIERLLPRVAGQAWPWVEGSSLQEAERRGGVTLRARRRP